ncbi:sugar-transfer associated ATP-grasp domain-containing protein [Acinetobacter radioresistens]|uniref:sugar-transfer associated ATP-grasp domain-containing protein n=1 Tax=Acinetobacter radioresistens TaxID=40216 RepID=UPI0020055D71|nr:sugar-transfer associated ATP-grasp domain-containing protein [Acinetobacter radioresistens]MCK4081108.1 hypothetical protein [Acinetobacter radioresistens]
MKNNFVKSNLKSVFLFLNKKYKFYMHTRAFMKRYKNINKDLFKVSLERKYVDMYIKKWGIFGTKVEIDTFLLCYNLSGKIDYNIVPENIFVSIIEPGLNKYTVKESSFLAVKNIYEKWFRCNRYFPKSYFHKIDNVFYDNNYKIIEDIDNFIKNSVINYPIVCKPSLGTAGGAGILFLKDLKELKESLNVYSNLIFQEKITQHKKIELIHSGISSIRTCLYRDKSGNFKVLNNSIRFGVNGSLDNVSAGGISCNIDKDGKLNYYAVSKYCDKYIYHPNSKISFSDIVIPNYSKLSEVAIEIANEIPLCNLVSLDMCLDSNNEWRCLEINLSSQTIRFAQYAGKGFFGNYTEEVIERVLS